MSLVDAYGRKIGFDVATRATNMGPWTQWLKGGDAPGFGGEKLTDPVKQHIACFRCVNLIGQIVSRVPFEIWRGNAGTIQTRSRTFGGMSLVKRKEDGEQVTSGPLIDLFARPNEVMNWGKFVHTVSSHLQVDGNFYVLRDELSSRQIPGSLKPLDPNRVSPDRVKGDPFGLRGWLYTTDGGGRVPVPIEEIAHGEYAPDPRDPLKGIGPLGVARITIEGDQAAAIYNRQLLKRGGQPGATLTYKGPKKLDDVRREEIAEEWERKFGNDSSGNRLAVLTGDFEYTPIAINPRDMQFMLAREWNLKDVARAFNIPLVFLNEFDASGLGDAGLRVLYKMLYESNIIPLCTIIAEAITEWIVRPVDPSLIAIFNFDTVEALREDLSAKAIAAQALIAAGWSPNAVNQRLDMGFEDMEGGDESLVAMGMTTRRAIVAQAEADIESIESMEDEEEPEGFFLPSPEGTPALPPPDGEDEEEDPEEVEAEPVPTRAARQKKKMRPPGALPGKSVPPAGLRAFRGSIKRGVVKRKITKPTLTAWLSYLGLLAPLEKRGVVAVRKGLNKERKKVLAALDQLPASAFTEKRRADRRDFYTRIFGLIATHEVVRSEMLTTAARIEAQQRVTAQDLEREIAKILQEISKIDSELNTKIKEEQETAGALVQADNEYMKWVADRFNPKVIADTMAPVVIDGYKIGANASRGMLFKLGVVDESTLKVAMSRLPKLAKSFYDSRIGQLVTSGKESKKAVRDALFFGIGKGKKHIPGWTEGGNLSDLKDAVRQAFNKEMSFSRARTIARTEVNIAQNTGRYNELRAEGVKKKQWLTAGDEKVRPSHRDAANDGPVPMDEPFSNGLMNPGDPDGPPEEVINCRCTLVPVLDDEDLAIIAEAEAALAEELEAQDEEQAQDSELQGPLDAPTEAPLDDVIKNQIDLISDEFAKNLKGDTSALNIGQQILDIEKEADTIAAEMNDLFNQAVAMSEKINTTLDAPDYSPDGPDGEPSASYRLIKELQAKRAEIEALVEKKRQLLDGLNESKQYLSQLLMDEARKAIGKRIDNKVTFETITKVDLEEALRKAGLPANIKFSGSTQAVKEALERGVFEITTEKGRDGILILNINPKIPDHWEYATAGSGRKFAVNTKIVTPKTLEKGDYESALYEWKDKGYKEDLRLLVDKESGYLFRGMSWEEWQEAKRTGVIKSLGNYNIGEEQEGLTFFSTDADSAAYYANAFAPWQFGATPDRPAVVIKIKDPGTAVPTKGTGEHERGLPGEIKLDQVIAVYEGHPFIMSQPGSVELIPANDKGLVKEGSRSSPSTRVAWKEVAPPPARLADNLTTKYKDRDEPGKPSWLSEPAYSAHQKAEDFVRDVINGKLFPDGVDITYRIGDGDRASYSYDKRTINLSDPTIAKGGEMTAATIVHEIGHALEHNNKHIHERAIEFLLKRAKDTGDSPRLMSDISGDARYRSDEIAIKDKFDDPYSGKIYLKYGNNTVDAYPGPIWEWPKNMFDSSEVVSMGLQRLYADPGSFLKSDPEYFAFIVSLVQGDI